MSSQNILPIKFSSAEFAGIGHLFIVPTLMIFHISLRCEAFSALIAAIGFFFCVNSYMSYHIRFFCEHLSTTIKWALEWLGPKMNVLVCIESTFSCKTFFAIFILTIKPCFLALLHIEMLALGLFFRTYCMLRIFISESYYLLLSSIN
jgi:hypothetical protein